MSKKFGKILAISAIVGAGIAIGTTYFKRYKKFHSELAEDFCEFEDNLHHEEKENQSQKNSEVERKYVSIKLDSENLSTTQSDSDTPAEPSNENVEELSKPNDSMEGIQEDTTTIELQDTKQ